MLRQPQQFARQSDSGAPSAKRIGLAGGPCARAGMGCAAGAGYMARRTRMVPGPPLTPTRTAPQGPRVHGSWGAAGLRRMGVLSESRHGMDSPQA